MHILTPTLTDVQTELSVGNFGYDHMIEDEICTAVGMLTQGVPAAVIARIILVHRHTPDDEWIGT